MNALLQFSGGKDSLALLFKMEALLPYLDVVMISTGDMPLAAYKNAAIAKEICPNFHVIETDPKSWRTRNGDPTSRTWTTCCRENIWAPMAEYIQDGGYRQVFRGTKRSDPYIHGVVPGDVVGGVIYTMPLWDWTDDDVRDYLGNKLPAEYAVASGMPDCVSCPVVEACGGKNREVWRP